MGLPARSLIQLPTWAGRKGEDGLAQGVFKKPESCDCASESFPERRVVLVCWETIWQRIAFDDMPSATFLVHSNTPIDTQRSS